MARGLIDVQEKLIQITNKHLKRCSTYYWSGKMTCRTIISYHFILLQFLPVKIAFSMSRRKWNFMTAVGMEVLSVWGWSYSISICLNILILYELTIVLLDNHLRDRFTCMYKEACRRMFIASLFVRMKNGKQPISPSVGNEYINWHIHILRYYTAVKMK